jgi:propionyl-CoA synthetase
MSQYDNMHKLSVENPTAYWGEIAKKLHWYEPPETVLDDSNPPFYKWFKGGVTNACYNAVDRWAETRGDRAAYIYVNPVENTTITYTYKQLYGAVNRVAAMLQALGLKKGDVALIYLPMIMEAGVVTMACARLGVIHSIVFAGFSKEALATRIDDARPALVICADGYSRGEKIIDLKTFIDDSIALAQHKPPVLVMNRGVVPFEPVGGRDLDWDTELSKVPEEVYVEPERMRSEDPSYILYTSGTTGKPKGVLRDTGGHMVALYHSIFSIFGCHEDSVYFSTSDIGWVVGHSYILYGPLFAGITSIIYDGTPVNPDPSVWFATIAQFKVDVMFSSPTAFRVLRKFPETFITSQDLSSLRLLFLAGEPLDPATYEWVARVLGENVKIVDNYWQTETGWPVLANAAGVGLLPIKPGSPTRPMWTWNLEVVDEDGNPCPANQKGFLVAHPPTPPGVMLTVWGDDERYKETYWDRIPGKQVYFTGDYAYVDDDGYYFVLGRADEVIKVASHRLGTRELEELLNTHPGVAENCVIGIADSLKGQVPIGLVVLKQGVDPTDATKAELIKLIRDGIGAIATPKSLTFVERLPKTRSGKVMRRVIKAIFEGEQIGDLTTIDDGSTIEEIRIKAQAEGVAP